MQAKDMEENLDTPPFDEFARETRSLEKRCLEIKKTTALRFERDDSLDTEPREFSDRTFESTVSEVRRVEKIIAASGYDNALGTPVAREAAGEAGAQMPSEQIKPEQPAPETESQKIVLPKKLEAEPEMTRSVRRPRRPKISEIKIEEKPEDENRMPPQKNAEESATADLASKKKRSRVFQFDIDVSEDIGKKRKK